MHYLYSITGDQWHDRFTGTAGHGMFVDMHTGNWVLVTHGDADGRLPCIEGDEQQALLACADVVVCCYPGAVRSRYPHLSILGDWVEPTWVTCLYSHRHDVHYVEIMSDSENTVHYGAQ